MKKILAAASAVSLLAIAAPAFAQHVDGSIGYTSIDAGDATVGGVTGRLSYLFNDNFGVEGEGSFGVSDDTVGVGATKVDVKLKSDVAAFVTAGVPLSETSRVYARVGYGSTKVEAKSGTTSVSGSDDGLNYGVGAQFLLAGPNGVRVDYTRKDFGSGSDDANVWSISYVRRFQ